jgi:hypothetical protein
MMEEPFFVEITFFLPEERPTGRFSESAVSIIFRWAIMVLAGLI